MNPDLQRRVQRYGWDKAADVYDRSWQRQLKPAQDRVLALASLQPGERVLDVACGTALATIPAAEAVRPGGEVLGVDLSDGMIALARRVAEEHSIDNVSFERMDAEALDVQEGAFDAAICSLGLMYAPDPIKALSEMHRALKPDGRVAVAVWGRREACGWADVFPIVDRRVASDVCPMFFQLGTGDALAYALRTAGFDDVLTERFPTTLHYDSDEDACAAAFDGGPVALAYGRFDEATRESARDEYLESIAPYRAASGYDIPGEFVVGAGRKPA